MKLKPKCCKTCIYSRWWLTDKGSIHRHSAWRCMYVVTMPALPESVRYHPGFHTTDAAMKHTREEAIVFVRRAGDVICDTMEKQG